MCSPGSGGPRPAPGLDHEAHVHAFGDGLPQALVGGGGGRGHGGILASVGRPGQVWYGAGRQAGAPAGIPHRGCPPSVMARASR